jgi:hypothetical protein
MPRKTFQGVIKLDVRDSKPDWNPYLPPKAPEGAPNVLFYNFLGIQPEQQFVSPELKPGKYTIGMEFVREKAGQYEAA